MTDYTIFTSQTPEFNDFDGSSTSRQLGQRFTVSSSGYAATSLRYWVPNSGLSANSTAKVQLWNETTSSLLAEIDLTLLPTPTANAWMTAALDGSQGPLSNPVSLNTSDNYIACCFTNGSPGRYTFRTGVSFNIVNGPLTATIALITNGGTGATPPTGTSSNLYFFTDVTISPASAGTDPVTLAAGVGGDLWRRYNTPGFGNRRTVPAQRAYVGDPRLLATAQLENELLGGADVSRHAAAFAASRTFPVPPRPTDPSLLTTATDPLPLAAGVGGELWRRYQTPATHHDRRATAAQPSRATLFFDAGPDVPPLTVAWGAGGNLWHRYNGPATRRPLPQPRPPIIPAPRGADRSVVFAIGRPVVKWSAGHPRVKWN